MHPLTRLEESEAVNNEFRVASMRWALLLVLSGVAACSPLFAQSIAFEGQLANAGRIESRVVDPYMTDVEERLILQRLQRPFLISPSVNTLRALPIAFKGYLPVVIDERSLDEMGISSDSKFDLGPESEARSAGANLLWLLRPFHLTFIIRQAKLVITTHEASEFMRAVRVYDVTPLLSVQVQNGRSAVDTVPLEETIQHSLQPDTWERLGGPSTLVATIVRSRCLFVVSAPTLVHLELDQLLNQMNSAGGRLVHSSEKGPQVDAASGVQPSPSQPYRLPVFYGHR